MGAIPSGLRCAYYLPQLKLLQMCPLHTLALARMQNGGLGEGAVGPGSPRSYSANYIYGRGAPEGPRFHMRLRAP